METKTIEEFRNRLSPIYSFIQSGLNENIPLHLREEMNAQALNTISHVIEYLKYEDRLNDKDGFMKWIWDFIDVLSKEGYALNSPFEVMCKHYLPFYVYGWTPKQADEWYEHNPHNGEPDWYEEVKDYITNKNNKRYFQ